MSPTELTLNGSEDISANNTSVSTDAPLDHVDAKYPNTAWGMNEMLPVAEAT